MSLSTQPYKGTRDFYPDDQRIQSWIFGKMRQVLESWGYQEYNGPMLESFDLYAAKSGEELVNKQLFHMMDQGNRKLAVRPEMTPTLARMVAGKLHETPKPIRWFSIPNLWRYERPQRGRLREHWQLNVDVLGGDSLNADFELLQIAYEIMKGFGGEKHVEIRVNHRGLVDAFFTGKLSLSADAALAVTKAVDAKDKLGAEKYANALSELGLSADQVKLMEEFFAADLEAAAALAPCEGADQLKALFARLKSAGIEGQIVFDPSIMRGLDYYTATVFEMFDTSPDNNRAMFGGGRYDNLIGLFGKNQLSGVGLGLGDVTLRNFLETHKLLPELPSAVDVFLTLTDESHLELSDQVGAQLRAAGLKVITALAVSNLGKQMKVANQHSSRFAVIFGESELAEKKVMLKNLQTGDQNAVLITDLHNEIGA